MQNKEGYEMQSKLNDSYQVDEKNVGSKSGGRLMF
ncbi:unnamed protein product, partial [marine sediment metagenome]